MNGTILQGFEWYLPEDGKHWAHLKALAPTLQKLGFSTIWLPPACKGSGGMQDVGYGVYDLYDLGEFDQKGAVPTKYGTKAAYFSCIKALHKAGLEVLADIVLNQRLGADEAEDVRACEVSGSDRNNVIGAPETIRAYTHFTFPGRGKKYSDFHWDSHCFDGVDWDDAQKRNGIWLFEGKQWNCEVDGENGNFDYLMGADVDTAQPDVCAELSRWAAWYMDTAGFDGVRLDAVKHITRDFFSGWLQDLRVHAGKDVFAVGEYWSSELGRLLGYLDGCNNCMSLFDVPLHFKFQALSHANGGFDLRTLLDNTLVAQRPVQAVTFVDNHDTQPGQALQSWVDGWCKPLAYATILLRESGYPCVFYGDLFGIAHNNVGAVTELPALLFSRAEAAYGPQHDAFDAPDCIGWSREGDSEHPNSGLAVVLSCGAGGQKQLYVGTAHAGESFVPVVGGDASQAVTIGPDGCALFGADGGSVRVYLPQALAKRWASQPPLL